MKIYRLIYKSLWFYRRTSLMVLVGLILSAAILAGALIVGDSVRYTLKRMALLRLGDTHVVLDLQDRYIPLNFPKEFEKATHLKTAPILLRRGTVLNPENQRRVNRIQVMGVNENFWVMGNTNNHFETIENNSVIINSHLAERLNIQVEDEIILRFEKANTFPMGISFTSTSDQFLSKRVKIHQIVNDNQFGRFGLESSQIAPNTVFVPLELFGDWIGASNRFNKLLIGGSENGSNLDEDLLYKTLKSQFKLEYGQLELHPISQQKKAELKSERVFINQSVLENIKESKISAEPVLTYFANQIQFGKRITPYSFITGMNAQWYPQNMNDQDIILNSWLANDLSASIGDSIKLVYDILNARGLLETDSSRFYVKKIVPINFQDIDASLTPDLPGLADAQNCSDWDFGAEIDLDLIRDKDENYWDQYKQTPKAFITYHAAQQLFGNIYGNTTLIRFNIKELSKDNLENQLTQIIDPVSLGFHFKQVRQEALRSSQSGVDFGELFLGLSFFVMASAFLLAAILFHFSLDQRADEIKTHYDLGMPKFFIYKQILGEGVLLSLLGSVLGLIVGMFYNKLLLWGLSSIWKGTVGTSEFVVQIKLSTMIIAFVSHFILAVLIIWSGLNRHLNKLYKVRQSPLLTKSIFSGFKLQRVIIILSFISILSVLLIFIGMPSDPQKAAGLFFLIGGLLLLGFIGLSASIMMNTKQTFINKKNQLMALALHSWQIYKWRHLLTIILLSLSVFAIIGVGVNRKTVSSNTRDRNSGTGGFAFYGEASLPIIQNLNDIDVQNEFGLLESGLDSVEFLLCRSVHEGDASCLNLNQISNPRILSVDVDQLNRKQAFKFVQLKEGLSFENPWLHLNQNMNDDIVPVVADMGVMVWGMFKSVGDTLIYQNHFGEEVKLVLIGAIENSIFQGNVLISDANFEKHFPNNEGYTTLLADIPFKKKELFRYIIQQNLGDYGIDLQDTAERLASFLVVENTYLDIFMALGSLGVLIGTIGMGILTARNIFERRNQLGLMKAIGFTDQQIRQMIVLEHSLLLLIGIIIGTISGLIATWPMVSQSISQTAYYFLGIMIVLLLLNGFLWILIAYHHSTKGELIQTLRDE